MQGGGAGQRQLERALRRLDRLQRRRELERRRESARDLGQVVERFGAGARRVGAVVENGQTLKPARRAEGNHEDRGERPLGPVDGLAQVEVVRGEGEGRPVAPRAALEHVPQGGGRGEDGVGGELVERGRPRRLARLRHPERSVLRPRDARYPGEDRLERGVEGRPREDVLRRLHRLVQVLEPQAGEVALLAQVGERGPELGRGLGVALDQLARACVRARGHGAWPFLRPGWRGDAHDGVSRPRARDGGCRHGHGYGCGCGCGCRRGCCCGGGGRRGGRRSGRERGWRGGLEPRGHDHARRGRGLRRLVRGRGGLHGQASAPEQAAGGLLGPLARGGAPLDVEDRVAARQVVDGSGEDRRERLQDTLAADRDRGDRLRLAAVEGAVEGLDLQHLRQVALVVLEDEGHLGGVEVVGEEVLRHLPVALEVLLPAVERRVRDEDERVRPLQHQSAGRRVHRLAGDGQDLQPQVEAAEARRLEGEEVEEDRPVLGGVDRDHLAAALGVGAAVQHVQVGRLPPDGGPVVDELDLDRAVAVIQLDHDGSTPRRELGEAECNRAQRKEKGPPACGRRAAASTDPLLAPRLSSRRPGREAP